MISILTTIAHACIKILVAAVIMLIAFRIIKAFVAKLRVKLDANEKFDNTLLNVTCNVVEIGLKILVVIALIGYLGIETSGIAAVIASLGVGVGLAVNGTLSNLAGGIMILLTKPFKVGDYISAQGYDGTVEDISVCYTRIVTVDNKTVFIPNSGLSTGTVVNFSDKENRRVDLTFSVAGNDPAKVRQLLLDVCGADEKVLTDPAPFARVTDYGAGNGVKVQLRAWCKSGDYWATYFDLLDKVQASFEANGIVIPFNQLDVHMKND